MNKVFRCPGSLTVQYISSFLSGISEVFQLDYSNTPNVVFDVSGVTKVDLLGQLLLYKFFDYTVKKKCFLNPKTNLEYNKYLLGELTRLGFKPFISEYYKPNQKLPDTYNLSYKNDGEFFLAPIELNLSGNCYDKEQYNKKKISDYYRNSPLKASSVLQCIDEITSNFKEHAIEDTKSIIVAKGNEKTFEVACADTGLGILTTLSKSLSENKRSLGYNILRKSIDKDVSSKPNSFHTGHGLWIVNEFVGASKGYLFLCAQNAYLVNKNGKVKYGECPYWKGTMIYVQLNLNDTDVFLEVLKRMVA